MSVIFDNSVIFKLFSSLLKKEYALFNNLFLKLVDDFVSISSFLTFDKLLFVLFISE